MFVSVMLLPCNVSRGFCIINTHSLLYICSISRYLIATGTNTTHLYSFPVINGKCSKPFTG